MVFAVIVSKDVAKIQKISDTKRPGKGKKCYLRSNHHYVRCNNDVLSSNHTLYPLLFFFLYNFAASKTEEIITNNYRYE